MTLLMGVPKGMVLPSMRASSAEPRFRARMAYCMNNSRIWALTTTVEPRGDPGDIVVEFERRRHLDRDCDTLVFTVNQQKIVLCTSSRYLM